MKKNLLAVVAMACFSVAANAETNSRFNGYYLGVQGGIMNSFANLDISNHANYTSTIVNTTVVNSTTTVSRTGNNQNLATDEGYDRHNFAEGVINLGFGQKLPDSQIYLGAEVSGLAAHRSFSVSESQSNTINLLSSSVNGNTTITSSINNNAILDTKSRIRLGTFEVDGDIRIGRIVNENIMLFARLGAGFTRLSIDSYNTLTIHDVNGLPTSSINALNMSREQNILGFRAGVGGEYFISKNMTASLDYIFTWYGSNTLKGSENIINTFDGTPTKTFTNDTSMKIYAQSLMLGLNYYFACL